MNILNWFKRPQLEREAFLAYFHKLPADIEVSWFRDGNFIVGEIKADEEKFMTQAKSADEFVDMVNETIYAAYDIPEDYFSALRTAKREFIPTEEQKKKLIDASVKNSTFSLKKVQRQQLA